MTLILLRGYGPAVYMACLLALGNVGLTLRALDRGDEGAFLFAPAAAVIVTTLLVTTAMERRDWPFRNLKKRRDEEP